MESFFYMYECLSCGGVFEGEPHTTNRHGDFHSFSCLDDFRQELALSYVTTSPEEVCDADFGIFAQKFPKRDTLFE